MENVINEFGADELKQSREFCLQRAEAHLQSDDDRKTLRFAAAGYLKVDAAILHLFESNVSQAREQFVEASRLLLKAGITDGQLAATLGGKHVEDPMDRSFFAEFEKSSFNSSDFPYRTKPSEAEQSYSFRRISYSSDQLFRLFTASEVRIRRLGSGEEYRSLIADHISRRGSHRLENSGLLIEDGVKLVKEIREYDATKGVDQISENLFRPLTIALYERQTALVQARRDEHHWRMMLSPAILIDLDLLSIFYFALSSQYPIESVIPPNMRGTMVDTPFQAARLLQQTV